MLPSHELLMVVDDPQWEKISEEGSASKTCRLEQGVGSGGATINALLVAVERLSAKRNHTTVLWLSFLFIVFANYSFLPSLKNNGFRVIICEHSNILVLQEISPNNDCLFSKFEFAVSASMCTNMCVFMNFYMCGRMTQKLVNV